jgi:hypothetical protein
MDAALRRWVAERAGHRCEYCHLHRDHQPSVSLHIEHIIARRHGGDDSPENLAVACLRCNLHKGTNLTGVDPATGELTPLFHPRLHRWTEHFKFHKGHVVGLTRTGWTTASLFQMDTPDRVDLRLELQEAGLWE